MVQHRTRGANGEWTSLAAVTSTDQAFSPDGGPSCESTYDFRVKARGDGETYITEWGAPSGVVPYPTGACNRPPAFSTSPYAFSVAEDAATSATVGTVSASDSDGDTVTYSIASGNGDGVFSINSDTGEVIVAGALDYESVSSYTLTVEARDGKAGGTAAATVEISVTDVAETSPPPPQTVTANSTQDSVTPSPEARDDSPAAGSTSCGGRRWRGERAPIAHEGDTGNSKTVKAIDAAGAGTVSGFANPKTPAQP